MSLAAQSSSNVAWSAAAQVVRQLLSLVSVSVLASYVAPAEYGIIGMAATVFAVFENLKDLGTGYALLQRQELSGRLIDSVFWANLVLGGVLTALVAGLAPVVAVFFQEPVLQPVLTAVGLNFVAYSLTTVPNALLQKRMLYRELAVAQVVSGLLGTATGITLAVLGYGVWSLVASTLTMNFTQAVAVWVGSRWWPGWRIDRGELVSLLPFCAPLSAFNLVNYVSRNADNVVIGRFLGKEPLGLYQMAYTLMTYPLSTVSYVIFQALAPVFTRLQDDDERFRASFCRVCAVVALITSPLMLGLMALAEPFTLTVLGPKWKPAVPLIVIFAPLGLLQAVFTMVAQIYIAKGRTGALLRWGLFSSVCYTASFLAGLPWGMEGVARSYALVWSVLMIPGLMIPFRLIGLRLSEFARMLLPVCAAAAAMALVVYGADQWLARQGLSPFLRLLAGVALGAILFPVCVLKGAPTMLGEISTVLEASGKPFLIQVSTRLNRLL